MLRALSNDLEVGKVEKNNKKKVEERRTLHAISKSLTNAKLTGNAPLLLPLQKHILAGVYKSMRSRKIAVWLC
jgi:hypothetical protein